jgi:hypothetical protein
MADSHPLVQECAFHDSVKLKLWSTAVRHAAEGRHPESMLVSNLYHKDSFGIIQCLNNKIDGTPSFDIFNF